MKKNIILSIVLLIMIAVFCCACAGKPAAAPTATSAPETTSNEPKPTNTPPFQMMNWSPTQQPADPINNGNK